MKKILCLLISAACVIGLTSCSEKPKAEVPKVTGEYKTTVLDAGKADAIVLQTSEHTILIDAGEKGEGKDILEYLSSESITSIDYLIVTHYDQDHIGGVPKVLEGIEVGQIIEPNYNGNNKEYEKYREAIEEKNVDTKVLTENLSFILDDVEFKLYPPKSDSYDEPDNDYSIVTSATHGENTFLYAGDCMTQRLKELPTQIDNIEYSFLKVPHHGKYCDGMDNFINMVKPEYAVITCSEKEPADTMITDILSNVNCETYETVNGAVTLISDGKQLVVTQ